MNSYLPRIHWQMAGGTGTRDQVAPALDTAAGGGPRWPGTRIATAGGSGRGSPGRSRLPRRAAAGTPVTVTCQ
jgi:hypothetical protein